MFTFSAETRGLSKGCGVRETNADDFVLVFIMAVRWWDLVSEIEITGYYLLSLANEYMQVSVQAEDQRRVHEGKATVRTAAVQQICQQFQNQL